MIMCRDWDTPTVTVRDRKSRMSNLDGTSNCRFAVQATTDKNTAFRTFMHYTDPEAGGEPITVFGSAKPGLFYNYSDRIYGDDWIAGTKIARRKSKPDTARFYEIVLRRFHRAKKVDLQHVMLGVNRGNGTCHLVFGYTYEERSKKHAKSDSRKSS